MTIAKTFNKNDFRNLEVNGYKWFGFIKGVHHFSKEITKGKWSEIKALPEDMVNENLEYFTQKG